MHKKSFQIGAFLLTFAVFIDAGNVDAIFSPSSMVRESYEGESVENDSLSVDTSQPRPTSGITTTHLNAPQANQSFRSKPQVDQDSPSLAAPVSAVQELVSTLSDQSQTKKVSEYVRCPSIYSLCRLEI